MAAKKATKATGHPFDMGGRSFTTFPICPIGAYVVYARKAAEGYGAQCLAADDLIRSWLPADQHKEWDEALSSTADLGDLIDTAHALIEATTNRPTRALASSR